VFGNLFAAGGDSIHRIDRHPTMKHHPVTPMRESDLRLHLAQQTQRRLALVDIMDIGSPDAAARYDEVLDERPDAVLFDGLEEATVVETARLIWRRRHLPQTFVVASSGFTHGLAGYWRAEGWIPPCEPARPAGCAERLLVLAGSCSPMTARQIGYALGQGFCGLRLDPGADAHCAAAAEAEAHLASGRSVVLYSALGPEDCREAVNRHALGARMGRLLDRLIRASGVRRVVVAGGDTASHAVRELGIDALTFLAPLAPGAPLCRAHAKDRDGAGLELVLKGGQVGPQTFFERVLRGS